MLKLIKYCRGGDFYNATKCQSFSFFKIKFLPFFKFTICFSQIFLTFLIKSKINSLFFGTNFCRSLICFIEITASQNVWLVHCCILAKDSDLMHSSTAVVWSAPDLTTLASAAAGLSCQFKLRCIFGKTERGWQIWCSRQPWAKPLLLPITPYFSFFLFSRFTAEVCRQQLASHLGTMLGSPNLGLNWQQLTRTLHMFLFCEHFAFFLYVWIFLTSSLSAEVFLIHRFFPFYENSWIPVHVVFSVSSSSLLTCWHISAGACILSDVQLFNLWAKPPLSTLHDSTNPAKPVYGKEQTA